MNKENKNLHTIENILSKNITKSSLPGFFFKHMAGIVSEDSPNNNLELFELIGDFIMNGIKVSK